MKKTIKTIDSLYRQKYDELFNGCLSLIGNMGGVKPFDTKTLLDKLTYKAIANHLRWLDPLLIIIVNCSTLSTQFEKIKAIGELINIADEDERNRQLIKLLSQL